MVYKLGNYRDMESLPSLDSTTEDILYSYTSVLSYEYGEDRNVDIDDGGYVLYAPPVNRGNVCLLPDFPKLHDVKIELTVNRKINEVFSAPDGEPIPFSVSEDKITLSLQPFKLHKLIILK